MFCHAAFPKGSQRSQKIQETKKSQTGRPYSAPNGGPPGVLLPFLTEDLSIYTTTDPHHASPHSKRPSIRWLNQNSKARVPVQALLQESDRFLHYRLWRLPIPLPNNDLPIDLNTLRHRAAVSGQFVKPRIRSRAAESMR